jgi:hypothetical protein
MSANWSDSYTGRRFRASQNQALRNKGASARDELTVILSGLDYDWAFIPGPPDAARAVATKPGGQTVVVQVEIADTDNAA